MLPQSGYVMTADRYEIPKYLRLKVFNVIAVSCDYLVGLIFLLDADIPSIVP